LHLIEEWPGAADHVRQISCQIFCHRRIYADSRRHRQLTVLKNDKRFVFSAASHAQRAVDYLHGLQPKTAAENAGEEQQVAT
jgi:antirestriction protein ArdC